VWSESRRVGERTSVCSVSDDGSRSYRVWSLASLETSTSGSAPASRPGCSIRRALISARLTFRPLWWRTSVGSLPSSAGVSGDSDDQHSAPDAAADHVDGRGWLAIAECRAQRAYHESLAFFAPSTVHTRALGALARIRLKPTSTSANVWSAMHEISVRSHNIVGGICTMSQALRAHWS
jgi:hypothetical protein